MNKFSAKNELVQTLAGCVDKVYNAMVLPDIYQERNGEFPYITIIEGIMEPINNNHRIFLTTFEIIGYVKGDIESLSEDRDRLENKVYSALVKNRDLKVVIKSVDSNNIYAPFGITAGVYPPYAAFRTTIELPITRSENDVI